MNSEAMRGLTVIDPSSDICGRYNTTMLNTFDDGGHQIRLEVADDVDQVIVNGEVVWRRREDNR